MHFLFFFFFKEKQKKKVNQHPWKMLTNSAKIQGEERGVGGGNKEELCRHERDERGQQGGSPALCVYDWMRWVRGFHTHL